MEPGSGNSAITPHHSSESTEDAAVTEGIARRDVRALADLYDRYAARAFGLAYRLTGDGPAAEDAVHDAFLWCWEHAERLDASRGSAGALLLTITHRRAVDYLRRRKRIDARSTAMSLGGFDPVDDAALALLSMVDEASLVTELREGLANLREEQRDVLELAYFEGLTHEQIAQRRALPLGTVKSRLRLGIEKLRRCLRVEGTQ